VDAFNTEPVDRHIEIAWFGIDNDYKGQCLPSGEKIADVLYATVEGAALADEETDADMPFTLSCDIENPRGRRFWESHDYRIVGPPYAQVEDDRYHRMVR
jgi:hypothetical protein